MGVSGGEEGARYGPSMMPGGDPEAYRALQPIVEKCAAQVAEGPCVTYIGPGASGNYVKMVHNGIEYADMQLLVESYQILRDLGGLNNEELHGVCCCSLFHHTHTYTHTFTHILSSHTHIHTHTLS